jgi:hypothetical protein
MILILVSNHERSHGCAFFMIWTSGWDNNRNRVFEAHFNVSKVILGLLWYVFLKLTLFIFLKGEFTTPE